MSLTIRDGISPELHRISRRVSDKKPLLEAMGLQLKTTTQLAFFDGERAAYWVARKKKGDGHALLRLSGTLSRSFRVKVNGDEVSVSTERLYAAALQFGYAPRNLPSRPFFPFKTPDGPMAPFAAKKIEAILRAKLERILHP